MSQGRRSRNKGANGEREVAKILNQYGFNGERNARNGLSKEDVAHTINGVHIEVKRSEKILLHNGYAKRRRTAARNTQWSCSANHANHGAL